MSSVIRQEIRNELRKTEEVKTQFNAYADIRVAYPTLALTASLIDLRITLAQGTGFYQRVGDRVRIKKYIFRCNAFCPVGQIVGPANLRLVFCKLRGAPNTVPGGADYVQLKHITNSNSIQGIYTYNGISQLAPYNTDYWTICRTVDHKIGFATTVPATDNDYPMRVEFEVDMTSMLKSDVRFSDGVSLTNQVNDGLFVWAMLLDAQQATPVASSVTPTMNVVTELRYTDA